jgi:hypothetical protein
VRRHAEHPVDVAAGEREPQPVAHARAQALGQHGVEVPDRADVRPPRELGDGEVVDRPVGVQDRRSRLGVDDLGEPAAGALATLTWGELDRVSVLRGEAGQPVALARSRRQQHLPAPAVLAHAGERRAQHRHERARVRAAVVGHLDDAHGRSR